MSHSAQDRRVLLLSVLTACSAATAPALAEEFIIEPGDSLSLAIAQAADGDVITLMPGTYSQFPGFVIDDKQLTLRSFSGDPADTMLSTGGLDRVLLVTGAGASGTVVEGLTIRDGDEDQGGGLYVEDADTTIRNCIFEENIAFNTGGGLFAIDADMTVEDTIFRNNEAQRLVHADGGAAFMTGAGASHVIRNCVFEDNFSDNTGALRIDRGVAQITACTFSRNATGDANSAPGGGFYGRSGVRVTFDSCRFFDNEARRGGAICISDAGSTATIRNSIFQGNSGRVDSGALFNHTGVMTVMNSTFEGNAAPVHAIHAGASGSVTNFYNSIVWNNLPAATPFQPIGTRNVRYNIVEGGYAGTGNVDADPVFASQADLRLQPGSPAIDAGSTSLYAGPFADAAGLPRGADDPDAPDTGESVLGPVVDMGAYERQGNGADPCPGDVDGNGDVAFGDILTILANWGPCPE